MPNKVVEERCRLEKPCGCFTDWVQCDNGRCIPKDRVCDGRRDCQYAGHHADNSDERDCDRTYSPVLVLLFVFITPSMPRHCWYCFFIQYSLNHYQDNITN